MNRRINRRIQKSASGQAAIEFLVTYGWAILGVMIVIGVLAYFGIFNTQRFVSDTCYFGDQLTCEDYILYNNSWTYINLRNNFGVPIDIDNVTIKSDYGVSNCNITNVSPNNNVQSGNIIVVGCNLTSRSLAINDKISYTAIVTFNRNGSPNDYNQTGDLIVTVQKGP